MDNTNSSQNGADKDPRMPSRERQSWGAVISICIILVMIVVGAFYAWGKRVHENYVPPSDATTTGY